jgi:hypothetical protein
MANQQGSGDESPAILIDNKRYELDDFELGELEWIEDQMERPISEVNIGSVKAMVRFVYVIRRREDPDFTLEDAKAIKLRTLAPAEPEPDNQDDESERPTAAAAKKKAAA